MILRRACLVVPGHQAKMHAKALDAGADEVVFDLEDAVAAASKDVAREEVARTLSSPSWAGRRVAVRVNPPGSVEHVEDLAMCGSLGLEKLTIVVPKVESLADVEAAARVAPVQALIESPWGLAAASSIASGDALQTLILGYVEFPRFGGHGVIRRRQLPVS